jgi:uncharacterized protein YacL
MPESPPAPDTPETPAPIPPASGLASFNQRISAAFLIAIFGLLISATLAGVMLWSRTPTSEVVAVVGVFISVTGTLVGAFLGVQVAAQGKAEADAATLRANAMAEKANLNAQRSNDLAQQALGALSPERASQIRERL